MNTFDFDLFVIGAGSGGVRAARMSAGFGARVAIAEARYLGGTCVNVGCVPKKLLMYASRFSEEFDISRSYGWSRAETSFDWHHLISNKNREIERLNGIYEKLLVNAGVKLLNGRATLSDYHIVEINGRKFTAKRILIATGGWPKIPDFPGNQHVISSNEVFFLEKLPNRMVVVGGGYIAVEFASIFNGLGVDTTLIYRGPLFLRGFDSDVRRHLANEMKKKGIELKFETNITEIEKINDEFIATLNTGDKQTADLFLYATGRTPNSRDIGLEALGIELDASGAIAVNTNYQSSVSSIYAIGDVTDRVNLTPVALAEGMSLAKYLFGNEPVKTEYSNIPTCVFSQPNIGTVGLSEEQAKEQFKQIEIYKSEFKPMMLSLTHHNEITLMKLIVDKQSDRVIGAHMVGPDAGEIIQGIAIAIKAGATKAIFDSTIGIHPTLAEEFVTMREPST